MSYSYICLYVLTHNFKKSSHNKKLDTLRLVEDEDFSLPNDVRAVRWSTWNKTRQSIYARSAVA